jgi:hypothetical protein
MQSLRRYQALHLRSWTATHLTFRQGIGKELQTRPPGPTSSAYLHVEWELAKKPRTPVRFPARRSQVSQVYAAMELGSIERLCYTGLQCQEAHDSCRDLGNMNAWIVKPALSGSTSVAVPAFAAGLESAVRTAKAIFAPDALRQKSNRTSTGAMFCLGRVPPRPRRAPVGARHHRREEARASPGGPRPPATARGPYWRCLALLASIHGQWTQARFYAIIRPHLAARRSSILPGGRIHEEPVLR